MFPLFFLSLWLVVVIVVAFSLVDCFEFYKWPGPMVISTLWRQCDVRDGWLVAQNYDKLGLTILYLYLAFLLWTSFILDPVASPIRRPSHPSSLLHQYRHLRVTRTRLSRYSRHYYLHRRYRGRKHHYPPRHSSRDVSLSSSHQFNHFHRHNSRLPPYRPSFMSIIVSICSLLDPARFALRVWNVLTSGNYIFSGRTPQLPTKRSSHRIYLPFPYRYLDNLCIHTDFLQIQRISSIFCATPADKTLVTDVHSELSRLRRILYTCDSTINISPSQIFLSHHAKQPSMPTVIDSGASMSLSPLRGDFITFQDSSSTITGVSAKAQVKGVGTVRWQIIDQKGTPCTIETKAYYVPEAGIRLYSPQSHFREKSSGRLVLTPTECVLRLPQTNTDLSFPYQPMSQLPLMLQAPTDSNPQSAMMLEPNLLEVFDHSSSLPSYHARPTLASDLLPSFTTDQAINALDAEESCLLELHNDNPNVSKAQLELLGWHYKLGHVSMHTLQRLMGHGKRPIDSSVTADRLCSPCVIESKYPGTPTCPVPRCAACILGKMERVSKGPGSSSPASGILRQSALQPGACISMDQYEVTVPGRIATSANTSAQRYVGGTIFVDHMSGKLFAHHQQSLRANDTLMGKRILEREACQLGIKVSSFLSDNGVFRSQEFRSDLDRKHQTIRFSGVGAHHQNGVAERAIKTICYLARTMLIHSALSWPRANDLELWPFAFQHAVHIWNHIPGRDNLAPEEKWTGTRFKDYRHLRRLRPWGCPAYVLDPTLQDGKKLPKWDPRSRQGKYLGFSSEHASSVALVLNLRTKRISPQFHLLFDDYFTTVQGVSTLTDPCLETFDWDSFYRRMGSERYFDGNDDPSQLPFDPSPAPLLPSPPVEQPGPSLQRSPTNSTENTPASAHQRERNHIEPVRHTEIVQKPEKSPFQRPQETSNSSPSEGDQASRESDESLDAIPSEGASELENLDDCQRAPSSMPTPTSRPSVSPSTVPSEQTRRSSRPRQLNKKYFNDDFVNHALANPLDSIDLNKWPQFYTYQSATENLRRKHTSGSRFQEYIHGLDWDESIAGLAASAVNVQAQHTFAAMETLEDTSTGILDEGHPLILAAKSNDEDSPRWFEATKGEHHEGFWNAMWVEITTLLKIQAWEQVERSQATKIVKTTWAFKKKRFPSGEIRKLKARFCVRGDTQTEGVDYFESFAPVVSWNTVRVLLVLTAILGLKSTQVDYLAAFCQAPIDTEVFIELPRGWERLNEMGLPITFKPGHVLKLKRSLYGLVQSPKNFFQHLKSNLIKTGFHQSKHDPCLFISSTVICLVYVDDCLFFGRKQEDIDAAIKKITETGMVLEVENDAAGFLGVNIKKLENGDIELTQPGLAKKIVETLRVQDSNPKATPAPTEPLGRDLQGPPFSQEFNYASVVGMLMYLCMHSRPDISFAVNQCARYTHSPTQKHSRYLKRIGRYLKKNCDKGLIISPSKDKSLGLTCYVDADFAGLWSREDEQDPHCVRSRGGWVITMASCPVIWKSKLLPLICLSTMESEYVALSTACRDLLPLHREVEEIGHALGLTKEAYMNLKTTIWEDNQAALKLANLELPYMTNRSKHIAVRYHWFRAFVGKLWTVEPISTREQLADIFTKGLPQEPFENLRRKLMGW